MAAFTWLREDESSTLDVVGYVAVEYEPAQDLLAALTGAEISGVALKEPTIVVRISSASEVSNGAEELGRFVSEQVSTLCEIADVDALVEMLREHRAVPVDTSMTDFDAIDDLRLEHNEGQLVSALLAGSPPGAIRERPPDDAEAELELEPSWLKHPDRAAYPIWSVGDRWVAVELDPDAQAQLDSVMRVGPSDVGEGRFVEVWFTWASGLPVTDPPLSVRIGAQCVGRLDADTSEHLRPAMESAADRDEDPWMTARLSKSSGKMPYVLEIALPEPGGE
jgi:hypothetical protein